MRPFFVCPAKPANPPARKKAGSPRLRGKQSEWQGRHWLMAGLFIRRYRREWVVDMDLSKCFDTLNHELILRQFRRRITDGSVLSLLRQFLESEVRSTS